MQKDLLLSVIKGEVPFRFLNNKFLKGAFAVACTSNLLFASLFFVSACCAHAQMHMCTHTHTRIHTHKRTRMHGLGRNKKLQFD